MLTVKGLLQCNMQEIEQFFFLAEQWNSMHMGGGIVSESVCVCLCVCSDRWLLDYNRLK